MKKDLFVVVIAAIAGFLIAYFVTNMLYPTIESFSFKTLDTVVTSSVTEPSDDIFNFRSINPTVEVYVGQCAQYNANGDCIESYTEPESDDAGSDADSAINNSTNGNGTANNSSNQSTEGSTNGNSN